MKFILHHVTPFQPMTAAHFDQPYNNEQYQQATQFSLHAKKCNRDSVVDYEVTTETTRVLISDNSQKQDETWPYRLKS